ncbi:hypothetical protein [Natrinema halophilum]|uniref:Uncharacterized protein n=1 Tax=Natrinema halophilum TaxID=1699371 RepID=A0A7D5GI74_9EURY|nr:hypothetical protein [Natrinema halophilum]QLG47410.1 hypothetical protein HYG82_00395 [Natrinema halophilum]
MPQDVQNAADDDMSTGTWTVVGILSALGVALSRRGMHPVCGEHPTLAVLHATLQFNDLEVLPSI